MIKKYKLIFDEKFANGKNYCWRNQKFTEYLGRKVKKILFLGVFKVYEKI